MIKNIPVEIVRKVVERKLVSSGALLHAKQLGIATNTLGLSSEDSIIIEFQGLSADSQYRMLVSFRQIDLRSDKIPRQLSRMRDGLKLDLLVFCTDEEFSADKLHLLKTFGAQVISLQEVRNGGVAYETVPDFIHVPQLEYSSLLEVNIAANEVVKRLRKKFHLVLSEVAADSYDSYGTFATREVMRFEDDLLRDTLDSFLAGAKANLAIDVGCGNGRHTVPLARHFRHTVAFDLSGRMVSAARKHVKAQHSLDASGIEFYECDIEYEEFPTESELAGKADFVCASFGMPSFVEDTFGFLQKIYTWLRPNGRALLTFYNAQSLALKVNTPWKERALSAAIDVGRHALDVSLSETVRFSIYCRPYDTSVRDLIRIPFSIVREGSFPHLMSILPAAVFGSDDIPNEEARRVILRMDRAAAWERDLGKGHYVFVVVEKVDGISTGYLRVRHALSAIAHEILEHSQVVSTADVQRLLGLPADSMLKTVVFTHDATGLFLIGVVGPRERVDKNRLAELSGCDPGGVRLAWAQEVENRLGFPIGGVSPVGYGEEARVFVDEGILRRECDFFYMGAGDNRKTLKLARRTFFDICNLYTVGRIVEGRKDGPDDANVRT